MSEQNRIFTLVLKNKKKHITLFNTCNTARAFIYMRIMFHMLFEIIENGVLLLLLLKTSKITSRTHRTYVYTMFRLLDFFIVLLFFDV